MFVIQVTGEAEYVDDIAMPPNGLHAALVLSTRPHARIVSIDASEAENQAGFEGFFSAKDLPGANDIGAIVHDEELFATTTVTCVGQVIGIVVADTHENAKDAARKIKIVYEDLPTLLDLDAAVAAQKFHPGSERVLEMGNVDAFFENARGSDDVLAVEGEVRMGGQEHFYLEPNSTLVWTTDAGNEVHLLSSTQAPQKHQRYVAHVLGIPQHKVVCKLKRIGGGFGGKETRSAFIAAAASVPAYLLQRPVRITLDRDTDMAITGQRHAFMGKYKVRDTVSTVHSVVYNFVLGGFFNLARFGRGGLGADVFCSRCCKCRLCSRRRARFWLLMSTYTTMAVILWIFQVRFWRGRCSTPTMCTASRTCECEGGFASPTNPATPRFEALEVHKACSLLRIGSNELPVKWDGVLKKYGNSIFNKMGMSCTMGKYWKPHGIGMRGRS